MKKINTPLIKSPKKICLRISIFLQIIFLTLNVFLRAQNLSAVNQFDFLTEARNLFHEKKYSEALYFYNKHVSLYPKDIYGIKERAICLYSLNRIEEAVYDLKVAKQLNPKNIEISTLYEKYRKERDSVFTLDILRLKRDYAIDTNKNDYLILIAAKYKSIENYEESDKWHREFLRRKKLNSNQALVYGEVLAELKKYDRGIKLFKEIILIYPEDHRLWSRLGYFYYWKGDKQNAIFAFEQSLKIKPFFREAMDGLDLAQGVFLSHRYGSVEEFKKALEPKKEFAIDKYYKSLSKNPKDLETRYKLIEELINYERFEEAEIEFDNIDDNIFSSFRWKKLWERYAEAKINFLEKNFSENLKSFYAKPTKENLKKTAIIALKLRKYKECYRILRDNFALFDEELAKYFSIAASKIYKYEDAVFCLEKYGNILSNFENRITYVEFCIIAKINLEQSEVFLKNDLIEKPSDSKLHLFLARIYRLKEDYRTARYYAEQASRLSLDQTEANIEIILIEKEEKEKKEVQLYKNLEFARELVERGDCKSAIEFYEKYFFESENASQIIEEIIAAYFCANLYSRAIWTINNIKFNLNENEKFTATKLKAKALLLGGDTVKAIFEYKKLLEAYPDNFELNMAYAEALTISRRYNEAEKIYMNYLIKYPSSMFLNSKLKTLPKYYSGEIQNQRDKNFIFWGINPYYYLYSDNSKFKYEKLGLSLNANLFPFLSLTISASKDFQSNDNFSKKFDVVNSIFKANLSDFYLSFSLKAINQIEKRIKFFDSYSLGYDNKKTFHIYGSLIYDDGRQILYSGNLINKTLNVHLVRAAAVANLEDDFFLEATIDKINVSDNNDGIKSVFLFGKRFAKKFAISYKYLYWDYSKNQNQILNLYYSPQKLETHMINGFFVAIDAENFKTTINGKIGIAVPQNFFLREIELESNYYILKPLVLSFLFSTGNSQKVEYNYNYLSLYFSILWKFY